MLEVKNLRKVYKTKKGAPVNALDGVTLRFPETGMVFLLGKSGSGKSTLLNVCGGLDSPTDGEIIVKGRSSKSFSQSDFDSYRNTFIGFVFQEYNILDEFSVEDNIALALELQGKPKDKAAINQLLEEVDLQGYAKRKPNTLSGGQKQRIAIARALIKAPEIIMADEPTGALDSNTGKQVLETLKKLSATKLVIVVSHDRDFAEYYGDRIIELSDGKVISDISKTQEAQQQLTDNINAVGDVLCVRSGAELTDADFAQIKAFLKRTNTDAIIASGEKDVANFKKVSHISTDGAKEVFRDTTEPAAKAYTKEESRFIRSKLPLRHAAKIGTSSLKTKPFRLCFTILLCTVAFTMFSMLSTLHFYDSKATFLQSLRDADISTLQLQKYYKTTRITYIDNEKHEHETYSTTRFTEKDRKEYSDMLKTEAIGVCPAFGRFNLRLDNSSYWQNNISGVGVLPKDSALRDNITGEYPKTKDQILISSYAADMLIACTAYDSNDKELELKNRRDLIGKKLRLDDVTYEVSGILDTGEIPAKFDELKDDSEPNYRLMEDFMSFLSDGLHQLVFVTEERIALLPQYEDYGDSLENYTAIATGTKQDGEYMFPDWSDGGYTKASEKDTQQFVFLSGKNSVGDQEVAIPSDIFGRMILNIYQDKNADVFDGDDAGRYAEMILLAQHLEMGGMYRYNEDGERGEELVPFTDAEYKTILTELMGYIQQDNQTISIVFKLFDQENGVAYGELMELSVVAVYPQNEQNRGRNLLCVSDATFDRLWNEQKQSLNYYSTTESNYVAPKDAIYTTLYLPFVYSADAEETYWELYSNKEWDEDESRVNLAGDFVYTLQMVDDLVDSLSQVFFYVALFFAVFAVLLFSNFISVSIARKKKEIGILRAVGARSADVFKIFFSESFVIALICMALSVVASVVICNVLNASIASVLNASLFVFGPASFLVLTGAALITVVISTYLPVRKAARKKPVESIRAL